jgi:hypothetical protein
MEAFEKGYSYSVREVASFSFRFSSSFSRTGVDIPLRVEFFDGLVVVAHSIESNEVIISSEESSMRRRFQVLWQHNFSGAIGWSPSLIFLLHRPQHRHA